jgi:hypothetical protein
VPSYSDTFSLAGIGIDRRYEADPEAAIRSGDFFDFIRGAGEPKRFEFSPYDGFREFTSGSDVPVNSSLHVEVQLANQAVRLVLKKNGAREREIVGDRLDLENAGAGVYRVEAFLVGHPLLSANVPWILSNPIFVGMVHESLPARGFAAASDSRDARYPRDQGLRRWACSRASERSPASVVMTVSGVRIAP